jgi:hypothetical protein
VKRDDFEALFRRKLEEAAQNADAQLGVEVPRHFGILRESPKADGRRISVEEAVSELFISDVAFYRIIDLAVVEVLAGPSIMSPVSELASSRGDRRRDEAEAVF